MSRESISKVEPGGFVEYGPKQLPKVDSMRRDKSQPDFYGVPILSDAQVLFTRADELGNKPASCYTCKEQLPNFTCERFGPEVSVKTVTGHADSGESIEYWPCCSMQEYTDTPRSQGQIKYHDTLDTPDELGLVWINAPKPGQKYGGANCGGIDGGDDCDHYLVKGAVEKWDALQGVCRVLQHSVDGGDVCSAWHDDDELGWREAQQLMKGESLSTVRKRKMVTEIVKTDK